MSNKNNKKASHFDALSVAGSRSKLGNHLPRIASGDGEDSLAAGKAEKKIETIPYPAERTRLREHRFAKVIQERKLTPSGVLTNNGVAGLPGRISLKAPTQDSARSSGSILLGSSWADKQRHLLQAYEYLCHVGEAQQWIEGCLGEELECGVVELEDALQNGVILARLVRVFQGEAVVRKIYEVGSTFSFTKFSQYSSVS
jgi:Ras GTPase-activating-like protein IQGAP2/3